MEENNKGGFSAEGRKLRPRRPRVSERAYSSSDRSDSNRSYGNSERRSYGEHRSSYGSSERRSYGEHRSYNSEGRSSEGRSYSSEGRSSYGERRSFNSNRGGERRFNSEGRRFNSEGNSEGRSYNSEGRSSYGERRSFNSNRGGERRFSSEGRRFNSEGNSEGRSYSSEGRSSYGERRNNNYGEHRNSYGAGRNGAGRGGFRKPGFGKPGFGDKRKGGFNNKKKSFYSFDDENSGINNMINRKPIVADVQVSAPVTEFKEEVRLNKYIANSGVCSRREADTMIQAGVVTVNGVVVTELGTKVNVLKDEIMFNGERLKGEEKVYLVMNKPKGYVTTASDPHADKTVIDLIKGCEYRVFPVGRLDKNTTGVLMLTNDGEIAEKLTHPSYDKKKIYQVILDHPVSQEDFDSILKGITLGDGEIKADELEYIDAEDHRKIGIEIHSGKNRIVRRIFESLGYDVKALDRVYFAGLTKKGLKKGEWRFLTEGEANLLKMGAYL
ncbi:MAG: pseudouridine synthase [Bacteroidales bacterium]|nr:pseudouridine synthase [Bacteroidales bacterium]